MPKLVLGIDPSARKIAVVAKYEGEPATWCTAYYLYKASKSQTADALGEAIRLTNELLLVLSDLYPSADDKYVWVEDALVSQNRVTATIKQAYVSGIIRGLFNNAGYTVHGANVSSWKKYVCGKGNATKDEVRIAVEKQWPQLIEMAGNDQDIADAAAITIYGNALF